MKIKRLHGREYVEADYLMGQAFHYNPFVSQSFDERVVEAEALGDEGGDLWPRYGAFNDAGDLIAQISFADLKPYLYGQSIEMAGVGGVSTLVPWRHSGAVRAILETAFHDLYDAKTMISVLYPFSANFYRKFGYEHFVGRAKWNLELKKIEPRLARPLGHWSTLGKFDEATFDPQHRRPNEREKADYAEAFRDYIAVSEACEARYPLGMQRSETRWAEKLLSETSLKGKTFAAVYRSEDGKPKAAIFYTSEGGFDGSFIIKHSAWFDGEGINALLYYLLDIASEKPVAKALWPASFPIYSFVNEVSNHCITMTPERHAMIRVIHATSFLDLIAKDAPELWESLNCESFSLVLWDKQLTENAGIYRVTRGGQTQFVKQEINSFEDACTIRQQENLDLSVTPASLALLMLGLDPAWAMEANGLMVSSDRVDWDKVRPQAAFLTDEF